MGAGRPPAPEARRPRPRAGDERGRDAAGRGARGHGAGGRQARHASASRRSPSGSRACRALQAEIWELAGREFTIGSPQQLGEVLFDELGLSRKRRGKTGFSTDARVLSQIRDEHEIVARIERWREVTKLTNTYLDSLPGLIDPDDGRIHTTFSQVRAATGRLSSTNPNLQNIPIRSDLGRPIRGCFVAEPGNVLVSCDYNQVELRVLAHVAGDEVLREIFVSGEDVHAATAAGIIGADPDAITAGERSKAKMVNYGIAYGLSAYGLADRLSIPQEEAPPTSTATSSASRRSRRSSTRRSRAAERRARCAP